MALLGQLPKETIEEWRKEDLEYMQNLKDQIAHYRTKIHDNIFNHKMRDHCKELVIMLRTELNQREKEYLSDYGTKAVYSQGTDRPVSGQSGSKN